MLRSSATTSPGSASSRSCSSCPSLYGIQDLQDDGDLSRLATNLKDGLSNGAIWALIAVGYTLVYGIIELINFAHGDLFMLGSFVAYSMIGTVGLTVATGNVGTALRPAC